MTHSQWWEANFLRNERALGLIVAAGVAVWSEFLGGAADLDCFLADHADALYTVVAPINAAMLGFILAAAAIIVTAAPEDRMTMLRESKHYDDLWACFRSAMRFLGAGTVVAVIGLVVADPAASRIVFLAALAFGLVAMLRTTRSIWAVNWVIRIFTGPPLARGAGA